MILAADYPLMDIIWTMLVFFLWVMWFWCLIIVIGDVFGRRDIGGWAKAGWTVLLLFVPFVGLLVYLIAHGNDMADRRLQGVQRAQADVDEHIRSVAGGNGGSGAAGEIAHAKQLLDSGAIDASEFEQLKRRALAS
jgi:energy-coupling factor transporter transmembrane protein EcfT